MKNADTGDYKPWHVIRCVELGATAAQVWEVIGGFYTIHEWHPDISKTEISPEQTQTRYMRRELTFPGQPTTTEELVSLDNDDFHYRYRWHKGAWGEAVKNYRASLRILSGELDKTCIVQWESTFDYPTDAISDFYLNGFRELQKRFPLMKGSSDMGSLLEINDSLQITTEAGFPEHLFNLERHRKDPITIDEVKDTVFEFHGKTRPRFFHLDPVRVYWYHNINGRWLAWGQIVMQEQTITRNPNYQGHAGAINVSDPEQWVTNGKYKVLKIYDPQYQEEFTRKDLPPSLSYFHADD